MKANSEPLRPNANTLQELGNALRSLRRQAGLSQTALGQAAGLSRMPVYRLEAGRDIGVGSLLAILQALQWQLTLQPMHTAALRPSDFKAAFAHLHELDDAP